ncbi:MAG: DUF1778 domain-containing protein [Chitinophagaceae bacterium]
MIASKEQTRFDVRLPKQQKDLFEKAAQLGGYRNLTDFMIKTLQTQSDIILAAHRQIIADETDAKIFFQAISTNPKPNKALKNALTKYQNQKGKSKS